jgi:hypothetical protein
MASTARVLRLAHKSCNAEYLSLADKLLMLASQMRKEPGRLVEKLCPTGSLGAHRRGGGSSGGVPAGGTSVLVAGLRALRNRFCQAAGRSVG